MANTTYRIEIERPDDSEITSRDSWSRVFSVVFFSSLIIAVPTTIFCIWGMLFGDWVTGTLVGFTAGMVALAFIAPKRMFIYNEEWSGYVTQNMFGGGMVAYGPGLHASYWWEQRNADGNYSLKVNTEPFETKIATETSEVTIYGEYEYAIDLGFIDKAIGIKPSLVKDGITVFIKNSLTDFCDTKKAEEVKNEIDEIGKHLSDELMGEEGSLMAIRNKYGYKTVSIVISRIALPKDVQETRDAAAEAKVLFKIVSELYGVTTEEFKKLLADGTVTNEQYQKLLTRAMAVSNNQTSIDVKVIEGLDGSPVGAVGAVLGAFSKGGKK